MQAGLGILAFQAARCSQEAPADLGSLAAPLRQGDLVELATLGSRASRVHLVHQVLSEGPASLESLASRPQVACPEDPETVACRAMAAGAPQLAEEGLI